jgi:hypothetical protein
MMDEILIPAQIPILGGRLVFKVYDEDTVFDELIGALNFNMKDFLPDSDGNMPSMNGRFDWKNVYGAPLKVSGSMTD